MERNVKTPVFSVGYGSRTIDDFIVLIKRYGIECLVDVRTAPYSRYKPEFAREALESALRAEGIRYVYRGDSLGGRPSDPECYSDGKVMYERVAQQETYVRGIDRLRAASDGGMRVALMCSEGKPEECHRSRLIGATLAASGIEVVHLDEAGVPRSQEEVIVRITGGQQGLWGEPAFTSRKRYFEPDTDE